jgi:hypothetical protein
MELVEEARRCLFRAAMAGWRFNMGDRNLLLLQLSWEAMVAI